MILYITPCYVKDACADIYLLCRDYGLLKAEDLSNGRAVGNYGYSSWQRAVAPFILTDALSREIWIMNIPKEA